MQEKESDSVLGEIIIDVLTKVYDGKSNDKLAYYCSASTAYSVVEHEQIWMRKTTCMNDYKEFEFGLSKLDEWFKEEHDEITKCISKLEIDLDADKLYSYVKDELRAIQNKTYIACLTKHENNEDELGRLSMWRAYGRDSGTAVVLNADDMRFILTLKSNNFLMRLPVIYLSPKDNYNILFNDLLKKIEERMDDLKEIKSSSFKRCFLLFCLIIVTTLKHNGFKEEAEMRYIYCQISSNDEDKEYDKKGKICLIKSKEEINGIPQIVYKLSYANDGYNPLSKVIIGPNEFPDVINDAFVDLLKKKGINNPETYIQETSIPLRV